MPTYDYFCEANQRTIEVRHPMDHMVKTWGELCELAKSDLGETARNAKVIKVINGGFPMSGQTVPESCRPDSCDAPSGMCCGGGACDWNGRL